MLNKSKTARIVMRLLIGMAFSACCTGCLSIDEKLFPHEYHSCDDAEKQFDTLQLENGPKITFLQGKKDFPVILYSYGNREWLSKKRVQEHLAAFHEHGYSVLAYEYTGYGKKAKGKATARQACIDIENACLYLTETKKIPSRRIIAFGYSVGTGPACYLASRHSLGGVILVAPFASAIQTYFICSLPFDKFPNAENLSRSNAPLLIYHGTADAKVPHRNALKVYREANGPKTLVTVPGADHIEIFERIKDRFWVDLRANFPF